MSDELRNRLERWIDAHFDELLEDLKALVRIPSVATYEDPDAPYGRDCRRALLGMLYVLRALEELGVPTRHGLRLCVGTDEEHGMSDVRYGNCPVPHVFMSD